MHSLDLSILYFFNRTIASGFLDGFADILTTVRYWYAVYVVAGLFLIYRYEMRGVAIVITSIILIASTDSLAHYILKPLVNRPRPCAISSSSFSNASILTPSFSRRGQGVVNSQHIVSWIRLPSGMRFDESFPSQHALNNFAMAAFFVTLFKRNKWVHLLWFIALVISLGRLYQGLHYPSDVLGGAAIGMTIGILFGLGFNILQVRWLKTG